MDQPEGDMKVLVPLGNDEAKKVLEEFETFKDERSLALNAIPVIIDGKVEVQVRFFKVADLSEGPKEEGFAV